MRIQADDDEILDEAIVAIGCTVTWSANDSARTPRSAANPAIGLDNIHDCARLGHDVEEVLHVNRIAAVRFGFV